MSWSMQGCEGGMEFLGFHPPSPHACADGLQARKEGDCDSPISLASQDWEMSEFVADASVSHYPGGKRKQ